MTKITLAHSDLTNTIYAIVGKEKIDITEQAVAEVRAIEALEQEPRKDEVILTNKEYRELMANEYDHGYCKGYAVALEEQESILNKIRAEIAEYGSIWVAYAITGHSDRDIENLIEGVLKQAKEQVLNIIDKYRIESEG